VELNILEVAQRIGAEVIGSHSPVITGVSIDSRQIQRGDLFVPLPGERVDGHDFIAQAQAKGAVASLVERGRQGNFPGLTLLVVEDNLTALQQLAAYWRDQLEVQVVAVTGSNGKTTTKDMVASILARLGPTVKNPGNYNNDIGLPLTLFQARKEHRFIVVEMGMRGLGEISRLAAIARPHIGVVTNVGPVHLELLGSLTNIARAKGELIAALPPDGWAVLNGDDPHVKAMAAQHKGQSLFFGLNSGQLKAQGIRQDGGGVAFTLCWEGEKADVQLPLPGRHNVYNGLAAAGVGLTLGASLEDIRRGLATFEPSKMRMEVCPLPQGIVVLNDAYNASPLSMAAALDTLEDFPGEMKIALLGDMLELGPQGVELHRQLGRQGAKIVDALITIGPLGREIAQGAKEAGLTRVEHCADHGEALEILEKWAEPGSVILVKASRGMALERVITPFIARRSGHDG
jgi:UDP-N-acetylmuramoyl-tripeptide--D-alanyl-D-alanine ligase